MMSQHTDDVISQKTTTSATPVRFTNKYNWEPLLSITPDFHIQHYSRAALGLGSGASGGVPPRPHEASLERCADERHPKQLQPRDHKITGELEAHVGTAKSLDKKQEKKEESKQGEKVEI